MNEKQYKYARLQANKDKRNEKKTKHERNEEEELMYERIHYPLPLFSHCKRKWFFSVGI